MMELNEDQEALLATVTRFAREVVAPGARAREQRGEFCQETWQSMCELGLPGLLLGTEYGGSGLSASDVVPAIIAFAAESRDFSITGVWLTHMLLAAMPISVLGNSEQKQRFLPAMVEGTRIGALCLTEPEAGSDLTSIRTTARRTDDGYVLNGGKTFISNAPIADVFVVLASIDLERGAKGLTMFLVERDTPGLTTGKPLKKRECNSWPTGEVFFDDCVVPVANLLGEEGKGLVYMLQSLMWERLAFVPYVGLIESNLRDSLEYATQRRQYGQRISEFGAVQAMLADMKIDLDISRLLATDLARRIDQGENIALPAAVAKTFITEASERAAYRAIQIFGGNGCMEEYDIGRSLWISKMGTIGGGTSQVQRGVIARLLTRGM